MVLSKNTRAREKKTGDVQKCTCIHIHIHYHTNYSTRDEDNGETNIKVEKADSSVDWLEHETDWGKFIAKTVICKCGIFWWGGTENKK